MKSLTQKQRWLAIGAFAVLAAGLTFTLMAGPFRYLSVCDRCGASRLTADWQLPLTSFTVFSRSTEKESPLSRVLLTNGIVAAHSHHWLFASGGGNGVRCAIGQGSHIRPAAESEEFAATVLALHKRQQIAFRDRILRGALDPDTSRLFQGLSFDGAMSPTEMQRWIAEQGRYLDEDVAAHKTK